jgi:hypothetical protein
MNDNIRRLGGATAKPNKPLINVGLTLSLQPNLRLLKCWVSTVVPTQPTITKAKRYCLYWLFSLTVFSTHLIVSTPKEMPFNRSISRTPVGLVTLTSVK